VGNLTSKVGLLGNQSQCRLTKKRETGVTMGRAETLRAQMKAELDEVRHPDENIVMFGGCTAHVDRLGNTVVRRGTLFVTDQRFGVLTSKIGGKDLVDIPLALIEDVKLERNITAAQITVSGSGVKLRMERMQVNGAKEFARVLREQMALARTTTAVAPATASTSSVADEILKLVNLQAKGLLTNEEFSVAKAKLLSESKESPSYRDGVDREFK
jgi:Bacterial PH domain